MKKILTAALILLTLSIGATLTASAQTYSFEASRTRLNLDEALFDVVLTPATLSAHEDWLTAHGIDINETMTRYEEDGVLLEAYDTANGRVLVVTAIDDVNARELFDINQQEESERRNYRLSHSDGTFYGIQGYDYESAQWKNYSGNMKRVLKLKYSLKLGGSVVMRGYQRRTVRNGYTITLDLQVTGRKLKSADEKFLDKIVSNFSFTEILNSPEGACKLTLTQEPDREVTTEKITIAGKTEAYATVVATLISLTDDKTATFSAEAKKNGKFSIAVTFPKQGTFSLNVLATTQDGRTAKRSMSVMYQRDYIPINLKTSIPSILSSDTLEVTGTTVRGVKIQISVSGPISLQKSKTGTKFSFTVDTSKEGTYQILLTATKNGMSPRALTFTAVRTMTDAERLERVKKNAELVKYSTLRRNMAKYAGKMLTLSGWVLETTVSGEDHVVRLAINRSGSTYKDPIYIICKEDPALELYEHVRMYGSLSENPYVETVDGGTAEFPRFELMLFEKID